MPDQKKINVEIRVMGRYFLYLPLYLAQFDKPESGKHSFYNEIPSQYSVMVKLPTSPLGTARNDGAVFKELMNSNLGNSDIMFAACDPAALLAKPHKKALLAASLVSSSAFWAVNHDSARVRLLSDLSSFDRIICYGENSTSNLIARRIVKRNVDKLCEVIPDQELDCLESWGEGTVAITPELLKVANLVYGPQKDGEKPYEIVFELSTNKEFSNVLTTALFTRVEVVEHHPELVSGLLAAIQKALRDIQNEHPIVKECVQSTFRDTFCLNQAMAIASRSNVFPETIEVRRDGWQRAAEFYHISHAIAEGRTKNKLTRTEELNVEKLYGDAVLDRGLQRLVKDAISRGFNGNGNGRPIPSDSRKSLCWSISKNIVLIIAVYWISSVINSNVELLSKFVIIFSFVIMCFFGWLSGKLFGYTKPSAEYAAHWLSFTLSWWALHEIIVTDKYLNAHFFASLASSQNIAFGILAVAIAYVLTAGFYVKNKFKKGAMLRSEIGHER